VHRDGELAQHRVMLRGGPEEVVDGGSASDRGRSAAENERGGSGPADHAGELEPGRELALTGLDQGLPRLGDLSLDKEGGHRRVLSGLGSTARDVRDALDELRRLLGVRQALARYEGDEEQPVDLRVDLPQGHVDVPGGFLPRPLRDRAAEPSLASDLEPL
jgi:hypothetical protein